MGEGIGIGSIHDRDRENVLNDPFSTIVDFPHDEESLLIIKIFNTTPVDYGVNGITGFNYLALKDSIKWNGLKPKDYVPKLSKYMSSYLVGVSRKK